MPRQNIRHLRNPGWRHRPDNPANCIQGKGGFESCAQAEKEDQYRIEALTGVSRDSIAASIGRRSPMELARALKRALFRDKLPLTPASARAMRKMRIRTTGWLTGLVIEEQKKALVSGRDPAFVTIIPNSNQWVVSGDQLEAVDGCKLLNQFRVDLTRLLGVAKEGWGFFALHGEYDRLKYRWHLHIHGLVSGKMVARLEGLRKQYPRKYGADAEAPNLKKGRCSSIRIGIEPPENLSLRIAYVMKSYWPWVLREHPVTGERLAWPIRKRIPEPRHSQLLLWLDRYDFHDLALLIGLRVQGRKLIRTQNLCTNGDGQ